LLDGHQRGQFQTGRIYISPADHHLPVKKDHVLVTKGARENRYRPGIDPLFRSAASTHGPHVVCGGVTMVQDPKEAPYPEMPQSALNNLDVSHCARVSEIAVLLEKYARQPAGKAKPVPYAGPRRGHAERVLSDVAQVNGPGDQVPYNCPNCGGVLWQMSARA
jgi:two-component system, chemotaxis family, protein-glutamate methylesterase/glutaminase